MKKFIYFLTASVFFMCSYCGGDDDDDISVLLPDSILNYLTDNYNGYELEEVEMETLCDNTDVYDVEIEVTDDEELDLTFDTEGNLLFTEDEISIDQLPTAVSSSIGSNYADYSIEEAEQLSLFNGGLQYEVELKSSANALDVLFKADGTVICEEVDDDGE